MKTLHLTLIGITFVFIFLSTNHVFAFPVMVYNSTTNWTVQNVTGKFLYSNPPKHDQIFKFQYRVTNGVLQNLTINQLGSYVAKVDSTLSTRFELKIPRNYPYSNIGRPIVSVLVNGVELDPQKYSFMTTDCFFDFSIPFSGKETTSISFAYHPEAEPFQGDQVPQYCLQETTIPEFPFAAPVLLIGIVSMIVFYRMKIEK
ncbi:MAG: hypothetical protein ACRDFB_01785 [Rhabdochlamydiaceae bacterium]